MFTQEFGSHVCDGDRIHCTVDGFDCYAFTERDNDTTVRDYDVDPELVQSWERDEWDYCGVCVVVICEDVQLTGDYDHALWGVDRNIPGHNNTYLRDVANDLLHEALASAREKLSRLATKTA